MFDKDAFAHRLKVLRAERRMNQSELAEASGLTLSLVSKYETCQNVPGADNLCALAEALGCTPNDLLGGGKTA